MNHNKYKVGPLLFFGIIITILYSCTHNHDENGHNHGETPEDEVNMSNQHEDDHDNENKEVHLNLAQYLNAEIDTGWFSKKNLSAVINANGYTKLDPQNEADVSLPISGTIKTVGVIEGNYVKRGQILATLVSLEYNNMLLEKSKLKASLGTSIAHQVYLNQEYERQTELVKASISAEKNLQKVVADLESEKVKILSIQEQINILDQTIGLISNQSSPKIMIKAPISGYITDVNVKIGSFTKPDEPMFSMIDNSMMHVDLLVYEKDLNRIQVGQSVRFILTNQSNKEIKGEIYNIGKAFANDTKSVAVHADIEKNDANLIPGMYINALIDVDPKYVNSLPEEAVILAEGREFIFLWEHTNKDIDHHPEEENNVDHQHDEDEVEYEFIRIEVKTGAKQLGYVQVTPLDHIDEKDRIVTSGAYYLQSHLQKSDGGGGHHH